MLTHIIDADLPPFPSLQWEKEMSSNSSTDFSSSEESTNFMTAYDPSPSILAVFDQTLEDHTISSKTSCKGVRWLMAVALSKNYSFQASWTALMLFYGYKANTSIGKQELEAILLVCLQLATKIHERTPLSTSELLLCCSQPTSRHFLLRIESQLLLLFDFEICTPHTLEAVASAPSLDEETIRKVLFLAQLYLTQDHDILFNPNKMQQLLLLATDCLDTGSCEQELQEIRELAFDPANRILHRKFASSFDVSLFLLRFQ